ncbi:DUF3299 domain-containing protein [Blastopirellula marina]|nr:DUF3299 domain-containing protein [Blastopirellula marina]
MYPSLLSLPALLLLLSLGVCTLGCQPTDVPRQTSTTLAPPAERIEITPVEISPTVDSPPEEATTERTKKASAPDDSSESKQDAQGDENLLAAADPAKPTATVSTTPKPQPGKTIDMTFDDIKFDIEPDANFEREMLPQPIENLSGQKIRIGGYMLPSFQNRDIKQFVLVRDNMECCFGPGAALYDCILVEMDGRGVDFTVRPVTVEGEFTVKEYKDGDGKHLAIYHLQGTGVR